MARPVRPRVRRMNLDLRPPLNATSLRSALGPPWRHLEVVAETRSHRQRRLQGPDRLDPTWANLVHTIWRVDGSEVVG
jgi:hypothetical protein